MTRIKPSSITDARRGARLAAVQALYQMEMSGGGVKSTVREYIDHRLGEDSETGPLETADVDFFRALVEGVVAEFDEGAAVGRGGLPHRSAYPCR